jgi:flavin-dependent thymidylate synthase
MCTVTIEFRNISRAISQQLTRHRAGISQESQRYVDYSNMKFINPCDFKAKYDKDKKYEIKLDINKNLKDLVATPTSCILTTDQIAEFMMSVYPQLREQGLDKEDARGFSLFNTETKLMMTFTIRQLINFLCLRTEKATQSENRYMSIELKEVFFNYIGNIIGTPENYLLPKYQLQEANYDMIQVDEALSDKIIEEVIEENENGEIETEFKGEFYVSDEIKQRAEELKEKYDMWNIHPNELPTTKNENIEGEDV